MSKKCSVVIFVNNFDKKNYLPCLNVRTKSGINTCLGKFIDYLNNKNYIKDIYLVCQVESQKIQEIDAKYNKVSVVCNKDGKKPEGMMFKSISRLDLNIPHIICTSDKFYNYPGFDSLVKCKKTCIVIHEEENNNKNQVGCKLFEDRVIDFDFKETVKWAGAAIFNPGDMQAVIKYASELKFTDYFFFFQFIKYLIDIGIDVNYQSWPDIIDINKKKDIKKCNL